MKQRTISAIILLILMVGSIIIDSKLFGLLMLIFSILGFLEFFNFHPFGGFCVAFLSTFTKKGWFIDKG